MMKVETEVEAEQKPLLSQSGVRGRREGGVWKRGQCATVSRLTASRRRTEDIGCTETLVAIMKQGQGKGRGESWLVIE